MTPLSPQPVAYDKGYRVNFRHQGQRYQKRFPAGVFDDPRKAAEDWIESVLSGDDEPISFTLDSDILEYLRWCDRKKSPKSVRVDRQRLSVFQDWAKQSNLRTTKGINKDRIRSFEDYFFANYPFTNKPSHRRNSEPNPRATWEKYRQILSAFLNWCVDRGKIDKSPLYKTREFHKKYNQKLPEIYSPAEMTTLFDYFSTTTSSYISAFFQLLAYTGLRLDEALSLTWDCVDLSGHTIHIRKSKNYKQRFVPIPDRLLHALEALPQNTTYVFDDGAGGKLYTGSWWLKLLYKAEEACQLRPGRNLHSFRHSYCTALTEAGVNLKTIMELAGHESLETTLIYVHLSKSTKIDAVQHLPY